MPAATFTYSQSCAPGGGSISINSASAPLSNPDGEPLEYEVYILGDDDGTNYGGSPGVLPIDYPGLPNQVYTVYVAVSAGPSRAVSNTRRVTIACGGGGGGAPAVTIANVLPLGPTLAGATGMVTYTLTYAAGATIAGGVESVYDEAGQIVAGPTPRTTGTWDVYGLPPGEYTLTHVATATVGGVPTPVSAAVVFAIPEFVGEPDPVEVPAPVWHPVGGVLPNPALLPVPVASVTMNTTGGVLPRIGLHVVVELYRPGNPQPFAVARRTIRTTTDTIDVSQYLRQELAAQQTYAPRSGLFTDNNSFILFTYRYKEVDSFDTGGWVVPLGIRYAVLAALPPSAPDLTPYIAYAPTVARPVVAQWVPAFPSGEAVQVLGYPLEVGLLLPPREEGEQVYLEAAYYDGAGQNIEIRSTVIDSEYPAGYYRYCLPENPLPCATRVELLLCNIDRAFSGTCADGSTAPGTGLPGYLLTDEGRILL